MIDQKDIENMILDFIEKKLDENDALIEKLFLEKENKIKASIDICEKLWAFEKKHYDELNSIYPKKQYEKKDYFCGGYFCDIYNSLRQERDYQDNWFDHEVKDLRCVDGFVFVSYSTFEQELGLSRETVKKYCEILVQKGTILRKRVMQGFAYKIVYENDL